jgi:hypothetical protein
MAQAIANAAAEARAKSRLEDEVITGGVTPWKAFSGKEPGFGTRLAARKDSLRLYVRAPVTIIFRI